MARPYNKQVKGTQFQPGDLILRKNEASRVASMAEYNVACPICHVFIISFNIRAFYSIFLQPFLLSEILPCFYDGGQPGCYNIA